MKTNHQRSFKDKKDGNAVFNSYIVFGKTVRLPLSDKSIGAGVTCGDHTNGKRGIAKDRRGAKNSFALALVLMRRLLFKKL